MKLIINTSNLYVGGGVQVALSLISELRYINRNHDYHIFLSQVIDKQIDKKAFSDNFHFYLIESSPSSLKNRKKIVAQLDTLETQIKPEIVFSIFSPTYWRPKTMHIAGFANGWFTNPDSIAFNQLNIIEKYKVKLKVFLKSYNIKTAANYYIVETNDAKEKFSNVFNVNENNIFVVGNTHSSVFNNKKVNPDNKDYLKLPKRSNNEFRLMLISHNYAHKNLKIIREVLPLLDSYNVKFILTIDQKSYEDMFSKYKDSVINLGTVKHEACPSVYAQADALFFPTLLETFSASYPEAMKMRKPILTSNYSFATDICDDAALYFDPLDSKDIADKIKILINDESLRVDLVKKGERRLRTFETSRSRTEKYIALCESLVKDKK